MKARLIEREPIMSKLWDKTQKLLMETDHTIPEICVGADVTISWVQSVKYGIGRRGSVRFPSVDKVERLYEFLSGKTLEV